MKKRFRYLIVILISAGFMLSGCTTEQVIHYSNSPDPQGQLVLSLAGEPTLFNPLLSTDTSSSTIEGFVFSSLVEIDNSMKFRPALAKSWSVSRDGLTWTFQLREDVTWHDGEKFTADDVIYTFNKVLDPKTNTVRRASFMVNNKPIEFKKISDYVIQARLPGKYAPFLSVAGIGILPKHIYEKENINTSSYNRKPIGTGPFTFSEWKSGSYVLLKRNEKYFKGKPLLSAIEFKIIPDTNVALVALENNMIDMGGIPPKDLTRFKLKKNISIISYDRLYYGYIGLNCGGFFKDKTMRKAFACAIDKKKMITALFKGLAIPAYSPMAPISWAYEPQVQHYDYDPGKSKKLLESLGYTKGGKTCEFDLLMAQGGRESMRAAMIMQYYLKQVGIKMNIRIIEWSALLKIINADKDPKDFDAVMIGWSLGSDPDCYDLWHSSQYPKGFNFVKYINPEIDTLVEQGREELDQKKRKAIYSKISKIIADDQPYYFLWYPKVITAINNRVGGYAKPGPFGVIIDPEKLYIKKVI